jgi:hypothetical protein
MKTLAHLKSCVGKVIVVNNKYKYLICVTLVRDDGFFKGSYKTFSVVNKKATKPTKDYIGQNGGFDFNEITSFRLSKNQTHF